MKRRIDMRKAKRAALLFSLAITVGLAIGCSERSTGPGNIAPFRNEKHLWSKRFGGERLAMVRDIAVDASGNAIVTGSFWGTIDLGGGALSSPSSWDVFVAKLGPDGTHLWSKCFGEQTTEAQSVAIDVSGNVIIVGYFDGIVDFGGGALVSMGSVDIFVAKFGPDGAHLWSKCFGDSIGQLAEAVAVDASGNVFVAGHFGGSVDFGGGELVSAGIQDIFIAKLGSDGTHLWSRRFGDRADSETRDIAVDSWGNAVLTGSFSGSIDFGGGALASAGSWDIFVAKFGPDGAHLWSKRFGDEEYQAAPAVAVDAAGNVIIAGPSGGTVDFGGGTYNLFIAKYGSDGAYIWSKRFGEAGFAQPESVATDASGNMIIVGYFRDTIDFGGGALTSEDYDIFVARFGADGSHLWSERFGRKWRQDAKAVGCDPSGNIIFAGDFDGVVDFGGGPLESNSGDIFVAMFGRWD